MNVLWNTKINQFLGSYIIVDDQKFCHHKHEHKIPHFIHQKTHLGMQSKLYNEVGAHKISFYFLNQNWKVTTFLPLPFFFFQILPTKLPNKL